MLKKKLSISSFRTLIVIFLSGLFFVSMANAGTLSCSVTTAAACTGTVIYRMSGATNAHAELPSQTTAAYASNVVCCSGVTGLSNACTSPQATALNLTAVTNSHASQTATAPYTTPACISVPTGGTVSVGYVLDSAFATCPLAGFDTTLGRMNGATNAHVGNTAAAYTTKICGTAAGAASLTFTVNTDNFSALTPGTPVFATSTLNVDTTNSTGWNVTLSGSNVTATAAAMNDGAGHDIADLTPQWFVAASTATTTGGNGAAITNGQDALAFRVMSASSTNGVPFLSTAWWGTSDAQFNAAQKWAGMASSTNVSRIGNSSVSSGGSPALNTVQYYLDVPNTQISGTYTGTITFTATANP